jgi:hypothetical protein
MIPLIRFRPAGPVRPPGRPKAAAPRTAQLTAAIP